MIALAIPHTPWRSERVESLARLKSQLGPWRLGPYWELTDKEPNRIWARKMWDWLFNADEEWCLTLQDDVEVPECFQDSLSAMLRAVPDDVDIVGLSSVHPASFEMGRQGRRWYKTSSWLVGWAYCLRRRTLINFLAWVDSHPEAVEKLTEDWLLNTFIRTTSRETWHPIPTIVDHDLSLDSTYGNDQHTLRRPFVTWHGYPVKRLTDPTFWRSDNPPLLPSPKPRMCWLCEVQESSLKASNGVGICNTCLRAAGRRDIETGVKLPKLTVATPSDNGMYSEAHARALYSFYRHTNIELMSPVGFDYNVATARARIVRMFLDSEGDYLLFIDADVEISPNALHGMWRAATVGGYDVVACPYPRGTPIDWEYVEAGKNDGRPPEARAYHYGVRFLNDQLELDEYDCMPVAGLGLGCCLLSRQILEKMKEVYWNETWFNDLDRYTKEKLPTCGMFNLIITEPARDPLSEDHSFFHRVRELGTVVNMYLGDGSPVNHVKPMRLRGCVEAFGFTRAAAK